MTSKAAAIAAAGIAISRRKLKTAFGENVQKRQSLLEKSIDSQLVLKDWWKQQRQITAHNLKYTLGAKNKYLIICIRKEQP